MIKAYSPKLVPFCRTLTSIKLAVVLTSIDLFRLVLDVLPPPDLPSSYNDIAQILFLSVCITELFNEFLAEFLILLRKLILSFFFYSYCDISFSCKICLGKAEATIYWESVKFANFCFKSFREKDIFLLLVLLGSWDIISSFFSFYLLFFTQIPTEPSNKI